MHGFSQGTLTSSHSLKSGMLDWLVILNWSQEWLLACMVVCLICLCIGPVIDWWPAQCVPRLLPDGSMDELQLQQVCFAEPT